MNYYGAKDLAAAFRGVRKHTLAVAEDIPENQYGYRATEDTRTVAEMLTHIALGGRFQQAVTLDATRLSMVGFDFMKLMQGLKADAAQPRTKAEILTLLTNEGEEFARAVEGLTDEYLGQSIAIPNGTPESRTRFDMLMSVKEHEMHHRGQLMLIERMLGIKPHLTRANEARMAAMQAAQKA
jgi:uncharacterized damage-inducible protein DinB